MFQYGHRLGDVSRKHDDRTIFPCRHSREFPECSSIYHIGSTSPPPPSHIIGSGFRSFEYGSDGYNGVLCALALGGKSWMSCIWAACSVLLSVVLQIVGMNWGIITLTAPFVLSVWLTMGIKNLYLFFKLGRKQATNPSKGIKAHTL